LRRVLSYIRRAVDDYNMIEKGDRIAVGVSGGKDSTALALGLNALKRFYPKKFEVVPITLDMGFEGMDFSSLQKYLKCEGLDLHIEKTNISEIVFDIRNEKNPCSLCAKLRRGALHDAAKAQGCNKVALGHHFDDVIETFFLSLFYEGRIGCFSPVTYLDRKDIHVIRPLIYMTESQVIGFMNRYDIPTVKSTCPADGATKREDMKTLVRKLNSENHGLSERVFNAIKGALPDWKTENKNERLF